MIRATRIEGLSVSEAAQADGIGESDVKVSVHRGLKALMTRIRGGRAMKTEDLISRLPGQQSASARR